MPEAGMKIANPRRFPAAETNGRVANRLLEGELLDLYVAILIVVPVALFLRSLWP
jgi:hypothetical protein